MIDTCVICGKEFIAVRSSKCCSTECRKEYRKEYEKKYRKSDKYKEYHRKYQKERYWEKKIFQNQLEAIEFKKAMGVI